MDLQKRMLIAAIIAFALAGAAVAYAASASRFVVMGCGLILDTEKQKEWYIGPDKDMNFTEAKEWAKNLTSCEGDWRLPTRDEIKDLYNPKFKVGKPWKSPSKKSYQAKIDPAFNAIGKGIWVWTGEIKDEKFSYLFSFDNGNLGWSIHDLATPCRRAFAVRDKK